jgi:hypothetical protein
MLYLSTLFSFVSRCWARPAPASQGSTGSAVCCQGVLVALGVSAMIRRKMPCLSWHAKMKSARCTLVEWTPDHLVWWKLARFIGICTLQCIPCHLPLFFWYRYMPFSSSSPLFPQGLGQFCFVLVGCRVTTTWCMHGHLYDKIAHFTL